MLSVRFMKGSAAFLAVFGMLIPQPWLHADSPESPAANTSAKVQRIPDLLLTKDGTMTGRVCDSTGKLVEGAKVELKQNNKSIGNTVASKEGQFSFKDLKGGIYHVRSGNTEGVYRVWTRPTAPPAAKEQALLVLGENGARGQFGATDPTVLVIAGGVIAAVAVSAVLLVKIDDLGSQVNQIPISP